MKVIRPFMNLGFCFILIFALLPISNISAQNPVNKYADPIIREIHDLADKRDSLALAKYIRHENPSYQGEALMCLGSVQAVTLIDSIAAAFESDMNGVRMAAAFALGQTYSKDAADLIKNAIEEDTVKLVRGTLYDALGKTGDSTHLNCLASIKADYQEAEGQATGILRFSMRGITSSKGNDQVLNILQQGTSTVGLIYATYHLARYTDSTWLSNNVEALEKLYRNESDPVVGSNLISAIIKGRGDQAGLVISTILDAESDYREKVNVFRAISAVNWESSSKTVLKYTQSDDPNLAVAAAEAVKRNAGKDDLKSLKRTLSRIGNWRARAIVYEKILALTDNEEGRTEIADEIISRFNNSMNSAERAWLVRALAPAPEKYQFVGEKLNSNAAIISTYAMECLTMMVSSPGYNTLKQKMIEDGMDLDKIFFGFFKSAIESKDIAKVSMASSLIRNKDLPFGSMITDTGFIGEAIKSAGEPSFIEAKNELLATLAFLKGEEIPENGSPEYNHPIDWDRVMSIPPRQFVGFSTSKGDIIVQLNVNWCPGTVSAFVELAEQGYYNGKGIHRVVPNFVVQDGCNRGDGWGGPPFSIRSEFTPSPFMEGTLGMASAGKDTEGSQWYFTHTATPHLDGKYSNFGRVIEGIDIVHKLELGDVIKKVVIIRDDLNK